MAGHRPTIPEVIERFADFYRTRRDWGPLHIVLDDNNVADQHVTFCLQQATEQQDEQGATLARLLLALSKTQRLKLPHAVHRHLARSPAA